MDQHGTTEQIESLLKQNEADIARWCRRFLTRREEIEDVEDAVQNVKVIALENFERLRNKAAFRSWLFAIVRNECNERLRVLRKQRAIHSLDTRQSSEESDPWEPADPGPTPQAIVETKLFVESLLKERTEKQREVVSAVAEAGGGAQTTGERQLLFRVRRRMEKLLNKNPDP